MERRGWAIRALEKPLSKEELQTYTLWGPESELSGGAVANRGVPACAKASLHHPSGLLPGRAECSLTQASDFLREAETSGCQNQVTQTKPVFRIDWPMGCQLATLTREIMCLVTHSLFLANGFELPLGNVDPRPSDPPCVLQPLHLLTLPTPVSPSWPHCPPPCPICSCLLLPYPTLGSKPVCFWAPPHLSWSPWGTYMALLSCLSPTLSRLFHLFSDFPKAALYSLSPPPFLNQQMT